MIRFNELRITSSSDRLIIDVSIENSDCCENAILDSIVIDTQDTYVSNGPSSKAVFTFNAADNSSTEGEGNYFYVSDDKKRARLILEQNNISFTISNNMFFVYIITSDGIDSRSCKSEIGTVVNLYPIYRKAMNYVKELNMECSIPKSFIDFILRIKALNLSIKTGNYHQAILYWNKMFKNYNVEYTSNQCDCYGRSD